MASTEGLDNGVCPSTHPVGLMKLFYEVGALGCHLSAHADAVL